MKTYTKIFYKMKSFFSDIVKTNKKIKYSDLMNNNDSGSFHFSDDFSFDDFNQNNILNYFINQDANNLNTLDSDASKTNLNVINNPVVSECLHYIANKVSNTPLMILRDGLSFNCNTVLNQLLDRPNNEDTFCNLLYKISYNLLTNGHAYLYYNGASNKNARFYCLNASEVKSKYDEYGYIESYEYRGVEIFIKNTQKNKIPHMIINIKSENQTKINQIKPLVQLYDKIIESKISSLDLNNKFSVVLNCSQKLSSGSSRDLRNSLDRKIKSNKANASIVLSNGLELTPWPQVKHDFTDLKQITELIQQLYGIPPQMLGGGEATHQGNMERFNKSFYESIIFPQMNNILSNLNYFLNKVFLILFKSSINYNNLAKSQNIKTANDGSFENINETFFKHNLQETQVCKHHYTNEKIIKKINLDNNPNFVRKKMYKHEIVRKSMNNKNNNSNYQERLDLEKEDLNNNVNKNYYAGTKYQNGMKYQNNNNYENEYDEDLNLPKTLISINKNAIPIYSAENIEFMKGLNEISFLNDDEKRKFAGLPIDAKLKS